MHLRSSKFTLTGFFALMLAMATVAFGQGITTSAISGFVAGQDGKPIAGATVIATHVPSGTRTSGVTRSGGEFNLAGLRPGGPYTVVINANGYEAANKTDIYVDVGGTGSANFTLTPQTIVKLEAVTVNESRDNTFSSQAMSTGINLNSQEIAGVSSIRRDLQDLENLDPRVMLMQASSSDPEYQLSVQGQSYRSNALLVDGVSMNDSFGLNSNSYAGLRNPIPPDWVGALSFDLNPYDVTHGGFIGAELNATLKSGTNDFHGSLYEIYTGTRLRGPDPVPNATYGQHESIQEHTTGGTISGPIIKNKLFFFIGYDAFREITVPPAQFFNPQDNSADSAVINQIIQHSITAFNYNPGGNSAITHIWEQNFVGKIDWNITDTQKFAFTFRHTAGSTPAFQGFTGTSFTSLSGQWYTSPRTDQSYAAKLNSDWSALIPGFSTELEANYHRYDGSPGLGGTLFPSVVILGLGGKNLANNTSITNGSLDLGTDASRQLNAFYIKEFESHLYGEYALGDHTFKFGGQVDRNEYNDTFVQNYVGSYAFANVQDWLNNTPTGFVQTVAAPGFTLKQDLEIFAQTDFAGVLEDTWSPNSSLTVIGGLRIDDPDIAGSPPFSSQFANYYGHTNASMPTGNYTISPRLGFNYTVPSQVKTQVRGGLGLFLGASPAVLLGDAFNNAGQIVSYNVGSQSSLTAQPIVLSTGQNLGFTGTQQTPAVLSTLTAGAPFPTYNFVDSSFHWPSLWKANLAVDRQLPFLDTILTLEADWTKVNQDVYFRDLQLKPVGFMPDGRVRYAGNITPGTSIPASQQDPGFVYNAASSLTGSSALQLNPAFGPAIELGNTTLGASQEYTIELHRPLKDHWSYSLAYTHSHATQVESLTSSVAVSNYTGEAFVNPSDDIAYRSDYAVPDKFVATLTREFNFFHHANALTSISVQAIWETGHPYSFTFFGDADGSGISSDQLFYVPNGPSDPKVVWGSAADENAFFSFLQNTPGLAKWQGKIVPRNSAFSPWEKTVNLHFEQQIPIYGPFRLTGFVDCLNFANLLDKDWGITTITGNFPYTRTIAGTDYLPATNQYEYTFNATTLSSPTIFSDMSRWDLQMGLRLEF